MQSEIKYLFIEKDSKRCDRLKAILSRLEANLPPNCNYEIINSTFDETLTHILDDIDQQKTRLEPAFVMVDPFGVSGTPMSVIRRILRNPKSEVYISFMYREINRFRAHPNFENHLDDLFGCPEWRKGIDLPDGEERKNFFYDLYRNQLKANGAQYVIRFELYEGGQLVYAIFFGTKNLEGCDKMKQAIWKIAPIGDFKFRGSQLHQYLLGDELLDFSQLEKTLRDQFSGKSWQGIESIENFVKSDATEFHSGHLKKKTLKPMEIKGTIEVKNRRRAGTYPNGTLIRFL